MPVFFYSQYKFTHVEILLKKMYNLSMKIVMLLSCLFLFSGCGKIAGWTSAKQSDTEQTHDPVYDSQTEMRVLVPWDLFI